MYLQACASGKRTDGRPWRHVDFQTELQYTLAILRGEVDPVTAGPGRPIPEDLAKLATAAGMQKGELSPEEWQAIQQAERERLSKITQ